MATADEFYVEPIDVLPGITALMEGVGEKHRQGKRQEAARYIDTKQHDKLASLVADNPWLRDEVSQTIGFKNERTKQNALDTARRILLGGESPSKAFIERAEVVIEEGGDAEGSLKAAEASQDDSEQGKKMAEKIFAIYGDPKAFEQYWKTEKGELEEAPKVGKQKLYPDGTIVQSTPRGRKVFAPDGRLVKGKEAEEVIDRANEAEISKARRMAGGRRKGALEAEKELKAEVEAGIVSAKKAAGISAKAFGRIEAINTSLNNLREAKALLDQDEANTGPLMSRLPSLKSNAVKLQNVQGRMGLDVVGSVTFGALSESELKMALNVALPTGLEPKELSDWVQKRIDAQEKLADYIESAAIYLGTPGNTVAGWMKKKRMERAEGEQGKATDVPQKGSIATNPKTGQSLIFDGEGWVPYGS